MRGFRIVCFGTAMFVSLSLHAQGLVLVEQQTRDGKATASQIQLDKTHIRAESRASGENMAFVFDENGQTLRVINFDQKTYIEMDGVLKQQMQEQLAQIQEQLKQLPPDQRAVIEQAMRGRGGVPGLQPAKLEYRQAGSDKVGNWACTKYEGYQGPQKVMDVCAAEPKQLGVTAADFEVAKHLAEFLQGFFPTAANQIVVAGTQTEQGFSGIPVRRTTYVNGRADTVSEIKEVRREAIPASAFEVPSGFKRQTPPIGR